MQDQDADNLICIAGDPILGDRAHGEGRSRDTSVLHRAKMDAVAALLRRTRGAFTLAKYSLNTHRLVLSTDRLGGRPLFWTVRDGFVIFAGTRRLILGLPGLSHALDLKGTAEVLAFGIALDERTEFEGMQLLQGGRLLDICGGNVRRVEYWNWTAEVGPPAADAPEFHRRLHEEFITGMRFRLRKRSWAFAALSGGLDSRCVVTALRQLGVAVHSLNVSWRDSLDQLIGREYASRVGSEHHEIVLAEADRASYSVMPLCSTEMARLAPNLAATEGFGRQIWGGDDGSISVGFVYVSTECVAALRRGGRCSCSGAVFPGKWCDDQPLHTALRAAR